MYILVLSFLVQTTLSCNTSKNTVYGSETCKSVYDKVLQKDVYTYVSVMPEYPGGNPAVLRFISKNFKYPEQDLFQASFLLEFVIDSNGSLVSPRISNKSVADLTPAERELVKTFAEMPKWKPGECEGQKVPVLLSLPLKL